MSVEQMREAIKNAGHSRKWTEKVKRMDPAQVVAIYHRLQQQSKIRGAKS